MTPKELEDKIETTKAGIRCATVVKDHRFIARLNKNQAYWESILKIENERARS